MSKEAFLRENSKDGFLSFTKHQIATRLFHASYRDIERHALQLGITPMRYKRNQSTISPKDQLKLFSSSVAIIGCGGLGGHIAEMLARVGVGHLSIFDFDIFEEHNLNRQNFSNYENIGREKVTVAKEALEKINPSTQIDAFVQKFNPTDDFPMISNADIIVDALDNPQTKLELAKICKDNHMGFVHGAIAGMSGQFATNATLEHLYPDGSSGAEISVGNPSFCVAFAASIQSAEIVKSILSIGKNLRDTILMTDLLENEFHILPL